MYMKELDRAIILFSLIIIFSHIVYANTAAYSYSSDGGDSLLEIASCVQWTHHEADSTNWGHSDTSQMWTRESKDSPWTPTNFYDNEGKGGAHTDTGDVDHDGDTSYIKERGC